MNICRRNGKSRISGMNKRIIADSHTQKPQWGETTDAMFSKSSQANRIQNKTMSWIDLHKQNVHRLKSLSSMKLNRHTYKYKHSAHANASAMEPTSCTSNSCHAYVDEQHHRIWELPIPELTPAACVLIHDTADGRLEIDGEWRWMMVAS